MLGEGGIKNLKKEIELKSRKDEYLVNSHLDSTQYSKAMCRLVSTDGYGLEIGPMHCPYVKKTEKDNIFYCDWQSTEELKKANINNPQVNVEDIVDVDFVWTPGAALRDCIPEEMMFDYILASQVFEHIPDVLGWIYQLFSVLQNGGTLTLGIPDKRYTFDAYRNETTTSEVIEAYLRREPMPTVRQIYDCLSNAIEWNAGEIVNMNVSLTERKHLYSEAEALNFATYAYFHQKYLDMHCTVWTPHKFADVMAELGRLGLIDVEMEMQELGEEANSFVVYLKKKSDKHFSYPPPVDAHLRQENLFLRKAYEEAVDVQKQLIKEKDALAEELKRILKQ